MPTRIRSRSDVGQTWNHIEFQEPDVQRMVWLASYPRSGSTLFRITFERMFQVRTFAIYETNERCKFPIDCVGDEPVYLIKSHRHEPANAWPAILLVRDGRAAMASHAHYRKSSGSVADRIDEELTSEHGWSAFYKHWSARKNVALLKFEDLVDDPVSAVRNVWDWSQYGLSESPGVSVTFDELHHLSPTFFRGGDWRADFTDQQHETFWKLHEPIMNQYGYSR